jgi:hypothetical protein
VDHDVEVNIALRHTLSLKFHTQSKYHRDHLERLLYIHKNMPKPNKSSASSGTRKKHAKKNNANDEDEAAAPAGPRQRGQKKLSKAQKKALPKIKQYIPPPKPPAPPIPDPLDGMGLARTLPAELVVVLRRLGKKDEVTRRKGLEELKEGWVGEILGGQGDEVERELKETALLSAVPVWVSVHRRVWMRTENISYTTWLVYCNHPSTALWLFSCKQIYLQYPQYGRLYSIVYPYHYYPAPRIVISWDHGSLLPWRKVDEREVSV